MKHIDAGNAEGEVISVLKSLATVIQGASQNRAESDPMRPDAGDDHPVFRYISVALHKSAKLQTMIVAVLITERP